MTQNIYYRIYDIKNLILAFKKARKGKTKRKYVIEFEENLGENLRKLKFELMSLTYSPKPLKTFILRDPKTRKISKSVFRDRVIHHAICNIIEPIFDKRFIYDSCANRIGKGTLFALKRFNLFKRKVTCNLTNGAFCFKADIKHYFEEIDHDILIEMIKRRIKDEKVIWLINQILENTANKGLEGRIHPKIKGMPLGNLTSQFFANVYLNELDYFVKNILKVKYYIRYVDDFVILHNSKNQLKKWKNEISVFLKEKLDLELHPQKSRIILLSNGVDFVGFKTFYYYRKARKRNVRGFKTKLKQLKESYRNGDITKDEILECVQGWFAYIRWGNTYNLRKELSKDVENFLKNTAPQQKTIIKNEVQKKLFFE